MRLPHYQVLEYSTEETTKVQSNKEQTRSIIIKREKQSDSLLLIYSYTFSDEIILNLVVSIQGTHIHTSIIQGVR